MDKAMVLSVVAAETAASGNGLSDTTTGTTMVMIDGVLVWAVNWQDSILDSPLGALL
jgi:hypothetical protein